MTIGRNISRKRKVRREPNTRARSLEVSTHNWKPINASSAATSAAFMPSSRA